MSDRPRQFGPGFLSTFMYYFVSTALVTTFFASRALSITVSTGLPQQLGLVLGLFAGGLGGYFNRTISFSYSGGKPKQVLKTIEKTLADLGYHLVENPGGVEDDVRVYQRSALARLVSGRVYVVLENGDATIASRAVHIRRLRKQLQP
jgi:hypothetical protein